MTKQDPLQQKLFSTPLPELLSVYDQLTNKGRDLKVMRKLAKLDLYYLMVVICNRTDLLACANPQWVLDRAREVQTQPDGFLDLWAREHYKSSLITFGLTLQDILKNPSITIGFISEKYTIAADFLGQLKAEMENNKLLQKLFPEIFYEDPIEQSPVWNTSEITVKRKGNPKEATITAQGLESTKVGAHYDVMVFDDVITDRSVGEPEKIAKITNLFTLSLSMSKQGGKMRFIGTRWSHADTYQHIIDEKIAVPRLKPATDDGQASGIPVLFSPEYWEQKVNQNSTYNLACQYLQNPLSGSEKTFNLEQLRFWDVRPYALAVYVLCDPGVKKTKTSCDTAMVVIGVDPGKHLFLLDGYCHRMSLSERWECFSTLVKRWSTTPGITKVHAAYEIYGVGASDVEYFKEQMSKGIERQWFEIHELAHTIKGQESKVSRIERIEPDLKKQYIFLPWDNAGKPTRAQMEKLQNNQSVLISKPIKVLNGGEIYDVTEIFLNQLDKFPFGSKVDLLDAFSRIYDCEIRAPSDLVQKYGRTYSVPRIPFSGKLKHTPIMGKRSRGAFNKGG